MTHHLYKRPGSQLWQLAFRGAGTLQRPLPTEMQGSKDPRDKHKVCPVEPEKLQPYRDKPKGWENWGARRI